jgi:hypothetical protein
VLKAVFLIYCGQILDERTFPALSHESIRRRHAASSIEKRNKIYSKKENLAPKVCQLKRGNLTIKKTYGRQKFLTQKTFKLGKFLIRADFHLLNISYDVAGGVGMYIQVATCS